MYRAQWSLHFHSLGIYMYVKVNQCSKQFSVRLSVCVCVCVWENSPFSCSTHFHVGPFSFSTNQHFTGGSFTKINTVMMFLHKGHCFCNIQCSRCSEGCALLCTSAYCSRRHHHCCGGGSGSGGGARKPMIQLGERSWIIFS
jgi:hypothetical protein